MPTLRPCPVCNTGSSVEFLDRPSVPVHQHLLLDDHDGARSISRGRLKMRCCLQCGFVFNQAFDAALLNYGGAYDNTQLHSPVFNHHVDELVYHMIGERKVCESTIVEIGCGKGDFLRRLVADPTVGNKGLGFDPNYEGPASDFRGRLQYSKKVYDPRQVTDPADVVICRHVIEHLADPLAMLRQVHAGLGGGKRPARLFLETPCVEWILKNQVLWDFFYEHCSLFTVGSLSAACERAGYEVTEARHVFGGQYLWIEARPMVDRQAKPSGSAATLTPALSQDRERGNAAAAGPRQAANIPALAASFGQAEHRLTTTWSNQVRKLAEHGRTALWGAGAKGVTLANLIDPECLWINAVVDVNPHKQGHCLPGTGHPIVSPDELSLRDISTVLVLNPNYTSEIREQLRRRRLAIQVLDLMHPAPEKSRQLAA